MSESIPDSDLIYLEVLEKGPLDPFGGIFADLYAALESRGLVRKWHAGYRLTPAGEAEVKAARERRLREEPSPGEPR